MFKYLLIMVLAVLAVSPLAEAADAPDISTSDSLNISLTVIAGGGSGPCTDDCPPPPPPATTTPSAPPTDTSSSPPAAAPPATFLDPFDLLPPAPTAPPGVQALALAHFQFIQVGEPIKTFDDRSVVIVNGDKYLTVLLPAAAAPPVLKTIGVTIRDALAPDRVLPFVLRADEVSGDYRATIAPFSRSGIYPVNIHILDFENQRLKKLTGLLQVAGVGVPLGRPEITTVDTLVQLAPIVTPLVAVVATAPSFYDLYLLLARTVAAGLGSLGWRRRRRPWGVVYDAVTKRPLDPAHVSVRQNGVEVSSAITDIDGRYSLFLPPGQYEIVVNKSHYRFPSKLLAAETKDELYDNLYHGGSFLTSGEELTTLNIPLDPVGFDWNEFVKSRRRLFQFYSRQEFTRARFFTTLFILGFIMSIASVIYRPGYLNITVLLIYILLTAGRFVRRIRHRLLSVRRGKNRERLPFVVIRAFLAGLDTEVKSVVADYRGRFHLLLRPETYYFTIEEKQLDGSYKLIHKTTPRHLSRGVLDQDLVVPG